MTARTKLWLLPFAAVLGCATAKLVGPEPKPLTIDSAKMVVLEPFFEDTRWQLRTYSETHTYYPSNPSYLPVDVTRMERWQEKPLYAKTETLAYEHRLAIEDLQKRVPNWESFTTSALHRINGPVTLVRVIVGEKETLESNRGAHNLALLFSWLVVPLLYETTDVREVERVHGQIVIYTADAQELRKRLLKYDSQPDYAVNTRGLPRAQEPFAIDLAYDEGMFAAEPPKNQALVAAFSRRLAHEISRFVSSEPALVTPADGTPATPSRPPVPDGGAEGIDAGTSLAADGRAQAGKDGGAHDDPAPDGGSAPDGGASADAGMRASE